MARLEQGSSSSDHTISLKFTPHTTIHARIQNLAHTPIVFLTTTTHAASGTSSPLGSFVYALPNRFDATNPLSTPLVTIPATVDFATRAAKSLARRTGKPVYVSSSIDLAWGPGGGGAPEVGEEVEALRKVVELVTEQVGKAGASA